MWRCFLVETWLWQALPCGYTLCVLLLSPLRCCVSCYLFLCPACHWSFLSLPCLSLSSLTLGPAFLPPGVWSCCPTRDILLHSPPRLPEAPCKRSSMASKEDRVLWGPTAFTTGILGARRTSEPGRAWLLRLTNSQANWLYYGFYIVKDNGIYVKLLLLCRKVPLTFGAIRKQNTSVHAKRFFGHGLAEHRKIFMRSSGGISLVPTYSFCQM